MTKDQAIARAREMYADGSDDNIEIDDTADVRDNNDGAWVQAWVWIYNPDKEQA